MIKHCTGCSQDKSTDEFHKHLGKRDGLQVYCKSCTVDRNREYNRKPSRQKSIASRRTRVKKSNSKLIRRHKSLLGCVFCSEKEPCALDYHHISSSEKDGNIATMISWSQESLVREIRKCVVICSNCHRKLHAGIAGYSL